MTQSTVETSTSGTLARWAVVGLGVVVCGLLFFADKSNLENDVEAGLTAGSSAEATNPVPDLPPVGNDEAIFSLQQSLKDLNGSEKLPVLDSLSAALANRGRADLAAVYALEAADIQDSPERQIQAGILAQKALLMSSVKSSDQAKGWFASQAISHLEPAVEQAPDNEEATLALGLSYVYSGIPANSMKGILTVRRVLEINPDNVEASYQLGNFSIQTGQFDKAVERFEQVLNLQPDRQEARLGLASALISLGREAEAQPMLETVVRESTDNELRLQAGAMLDNIR